MNIIELTPSEDLEAELQLNDDRWEEANRYAGLFNTPADEDFHIIARARYEQLCAQNWRP